MTGEARNRCKLKVFLSATSTMINTSITRWWNSCRLSQRFHYHSNCLLAGAPKSTTEKLQRVMNAAARLINNTRKFDRGLTYMLFHILHWLDVSDRIKFRLCVTVYTCVHGMAPGYPSELCRPVSALQGWRHAFCRSRPSLTFLNPSINQVLSQSNFL